MKYILFGGLIGIILLMNTSCKRKCTSDLKNIIKVQFYNKETLRLDTVVFERIQGLGVDSILYTAKDSLVNTYQLPASDGQDMIDFVFTRKEGSLLKGYTLRLTYKRQLTINTPGCGAFNRIENLQVPFSDFDSVVVINPFLDNTSNANIQIFF